jgi:uncharacterized membrane protein YagU involved in acid resistance
MNTKIKGGVLGGIAGGVVFGLLMHMKGVMPMIAMMIGSESVFVGWILHLIISAVTGVLFVYTLGGSPETYGKGIGMGVVYGVIWWVLGALILMPVILGMGVQFVNAFDTMRMMSLMGHAIFGAILGAIVVMQSQ